MIVIERTKTPTKEQLINIPKNLREKYNRASSLKVNHMASEYIAEVSVTFWLWINDTHGEFYDSWESLLNKYFELMEDSNG
jgi:hypothetical protein